MKTRGSSVIEPGVSSQLWPEVQPRSIQPGRLHLVSCHEVEQLRQALARGVVPADLESKLARLAKGGLLHRFVEQNCRTIIALLLAVQEGAFTDASPEECETLLRVVAYVRKDDDDVADYKPGGFVDDQEELRAVLVRLGELLPAFKAWHLCHQVPAMWQS